MLDGLVERRADRLGRRCGIWFACGRLRLRLLANPAAAQKIDATIVSDKEKPRSKGTCVVEGLQFLVGVEECLLDDVPAIQHRSGHACAVAVQTWTQRRDCPEKGKVPRFERTTAGVRRVSAIDAR